MIVGARVDFRLIHGQVGNLWANARQVSRFMVVDDQVSEDAVQKHVESEKGQAAEARADAANGRQMAHRRLERLRDRLLRERLLGRAALLGGGLVDLEERGLFDRGIWFVVIVAQLLKLIQKARSV